MNFIWRLGLPDSMESESENPVALGQQSDVLLKNTPQE
jgi:hypothetical protein